MAYATTPTHGKLYRIEKNDIAMSFSTGWSINATLDMADKSSQGDSWKSALPGLAGATGSFNFNLAPGNTEQIAFINNILTATPGTKLTDVKFLLDASTNAITGNIYITGISFNAALSAVASATVNFQFDDAVSITNAA